MPAPSSSPATTGEYTPFSPYQSAPSLTLTRTKNQTPATPSSLCTTLGAAESFSPAHLDKPEIKDLIERAQAYYLGGFFLTHGLESALKLAKQAAEKNKVGSFPSFLLDIVGLAMRWFRVCRSVC